MNIAVTKDDIKPGFTTHQELHPTQILSVVASLTPFSDFNQSPRNMYQCQVNDNKLIMWIGYLSCPYIQMGKQTMGTPFHAYPYRVDGGKVYRIQHPQKPLVQTMAQNKYDINSYPSGTNAVVAVISYTGYDMEDAMIINKSAYERGFGHGSVYTTVFVDIVPEYVHYCIASVLSLILLIQRHKSSWAKSILFFKRPCCLRRFLGWGRSATYLMLYCCVKSLLTPVDVGRLMHKGDPFYSFVMDPQKIYQVKKFKYKEPAYIENVTIICMLILLVCEQANFL